MASFLCAFPHLFVCTTSLRRSDYITDLACSRLGMEPAELSEIAKNREVLQVPLGLLLPRLS